MNNQKVGWIGLGNMGTPIVHNLLKANVPVAVFNRNRDKERELIAAGASPSDSPARLAADCDIIFTMVSDDAAVRAIVEGEGGVLSGARPGQLLIDMSTVSPETSRHLAAACKKADMQFMEAPVSGSVKQAQDGTLIILAGGSREAFERAKPLFDIIGKLALHLGDNGKGSSAKLAINYMVALTTQSLAEIVLFAGRNGIRKEDMLTIINESAVGSTYSKIKSGSILNNAYPPAFALRLMAKDLRLMKDAGLDSPLFSPVYETFQEAEKEGLANEDLMAVIRYLSE